jgi:hypothetical protein
MGLAEFFDISLERANDLYTWGWRFSAFGAVITMIGVAALWMGTRVRDRDFETQISGLNATTAETLERAGKLEREAAGLRLELDREVQKRAQRLLTDEQKADIANELNGKISEIALVVQHELETRVFSLQIMAALPQGITTYAPEPPREDKWFVPAGLIMYSPFGSTEEQLKDDPLYRALKKANLFGGLTSRPFLSPDLRGPTPALIEGYKGRVLYIGQKSPF